MNPTKEDAVKRYVKACQQFDKENACSVLNLNSVISLWEDAQTTVHPEKDHVLEKYRHIPESVIKSIKRLIAHNNELQEILFSGKGEDTKTLEEYIDAKNKFWSDLRNIAKDLNK